MTKGQVRHLGVVLSHYYNGQVKTKIQQRFPFDWR